MPTSSEESIEPEVPAVVLAPDQLAELDGNVPKDVGSFAVWAAQIERS